MKILKRTNKIIFFILILLNGIPLSAQTIEVRAEDEPLNRVFVHLRDAYNIKFSFDDQLLSKYIVNLSKDFDTPDKAVEELIRVFPLSMEKSEGVFIIYPDNPGGDYRSSEKRVFIGVISDALSGESLPYSHISINNKHLISDAHGGFSHTSSVDTTFRIQASYLGYYNLDSIVYPDGKHQLYMQPASIDLEEIIIEDKSRKLSTMSSYNSGEMRLNRKAGRFLPGFADNSLYNLLRLQPGVLAAGEQSNDLIIWGSYSGQTEVLFDGITLFGLKNFNDNIGIVNPFLIKDVKLLKGGYPVNYGGKAGGIVDITGISGNVKKPEFILSATNMTLNTQLSFPVTKRSSFNIAFRQTYYNLYNKTDLSNFNRGRKENTDLIDLAVTPDYNFRDLNLKYAGSTISGDNYFIDFLIGSDKFNYLVNFSTPNNNLIKNLTDETNTQSGGSAYYEKAWENGNKTDFTFSFSRLNNKMINQTNVDTKNIQDYLWRYENSENQISKIKADIDQKIHLNSSNILDIGMELFNYNISLQEDSLNTNILYDVRKTVGIGSYIQDHISFKNGVNITAGLRVDIPSYLEKALIQPRISLNYEVSPELWLKAAWGKYDQYVVQSSVLDEAGNYRYFWTLSDGDEIPVQSSKHLTAGLTYQKPSFCFGLEAYYKTLDGLTRYIYQPNRFERDIYTGEGRSLGIDFLVEAKYKKHSAWLGYSLSQTIERFTYFPRNTYRRSPQDQKHELKLAALFDFSPFFISSNFVYGSGFPDRSIQQFGRSTTDLKYKRLDISAVYKFSFNKFNLQTGLSVLNVFNSRNIKLQNLVKVPYSQTNSINILAEAVPFTPTIFLIIGF